VLLVHVDGSFANLALMRIAAHHGRLGDTVRLTRNYKDAVAALESYDKVYASAIFSSVPPAGGNPALQGGEEPALACVRRVC
jgi:hypothetical protein